MLVLVSAGIVVSDGQILMARRKNAGPNALKWEFPGGKLEVGETPEMALRRELGEELGIRVSVGRIFDAQMNDERTLMVLFYFSTLMSGAPQAIDCEDFRWCRPEALTKLDLAPLDARVAAALIRERTKREELNGQFQPDPQAGRRSGQVYAQHDEFRPREDGGLGHGFERSSTE